jgi:hypothetical protein
MTHRSKAEVQDPTPADVPGRRASLPSHAPFCLSGGAPSGASAPMRQAVLSVGWLKKQSPSPSSDASALTGPPLQH